MHPLTSQATAPAKLVLDELVRRGCTITARTRVQVHDHKLGAHPVTYAHKLQVWGGGLTPDLRAAIEDHRDELLAAACVLHPPVGWLEVMVRRYRTQAPIEVRRQRWRGPYRVSLPMLAASVAMFMGKTAIEGPSLQPIIKEVLSA